MCGTTDINSNADRISMSEIYPNPTSGNLFIQSDLNSNYRILNLLGVEVLNGEFSKGENKLDLTRLNNGIYFIQSGRESQKILLLK